MKNDARARSVKCSLDKHEDLRLIPSMHGKDWGVEACNPSAEEADTENPEVYLPVSLA